jgi:hypothetical protein
MSEYSRGPSGAIRGMSEHTVLALGSVCYVSATEQVLAVHGTEAAKEQYGKEG